MGKDQGSFAISPVEAGIEHAEDTDTNYSVRRIEPVIFTRAELEELGLTQLYAEGYDLRLPPNELLQYTQEAYSGDGDILYVAESAQGKIIATSMFQKLSTENLDWNGRTFWGIIETKDKELIDKARGLAKNESFLSINSRGVVTLPQYQGSGIQRNLSEQAIRDLDPLIITGESKAPKAVSLRAKIADENGYRTFFGSYEVTPGVLLTNDIPHGAILQAYSRMGENPIMGNGLIAVSAKRYNPYVPTVNGFSDSIQNAFKLLIAAQSARRDVTFHAPLISVKRELLV